MLSKNESKSFYAAMEYARKWCNENQLVLGVGEMAIGAGLVAWGVHNGTIEMGTQLVTTEVGGSNIESVLGAVGGSGIGAVAGSILGSIGVVGMGGAIGIPAVIVAGGAAAVLGMAGYTAGDLLHNMTTQAIDINSLARNGSVLLVGVALMVDGARRCINDKKVLSALSVFKERVIIINKISVRIIATKLNEVQAFDGATASMGGATFGAAIGASAGSVVAASSVTVLGSQALGGVAISLGLASAPVWPVIAGIAGGAGLGYAACKAIKCWGQNDQEDAIPEGNPTVLHYR